MDFSRSAKSRLTMHDVERFPGESLFERVGRAVCSAECLPRKELYEGWATARRVRRLFRGGRVVDLAAGHGLLAQLLLILDDSSPRAVAVDTTIPPSAAAVQRTLTAQWPRLAGRIEFVTAQLADVSIGPDDLVVSVHACGALTDVVLDRAAAARARVAVLPCCHDADASDTGALAGWMDNALAIDAVRARKLAERGYRIWTQTIPADITGKNRLLIGSPVGA